MPPEPSPGRRIPTTDIVRPKGLWRFVFTRLATVAAIALVMVWVLNNTRRGVTEAVIFLAAIALVAAVQVPLLKSRWRRLDQQRLAALPEGAIYAGPARAESSSGSGGRPVPGELLLDRGGVSFTPRRADATVPSKLSWAGISHVELRPVAAAPLAGSLVLTVGGGIKHSFLVQRCEGLADVLSELAQLL